MVDKNRIEIVRPISDSLSPTFCLAKWHHTTIYLQTGETHSCYHPRPHGIPLDQIKLNPSILHNTPTKKAERREMMEGQKPNGCRYCWNIESLGNDYVSDRHIRNASIYTPERLEEIKKLGWDFNVNPEYVEISFGNECQMSCVYCHPKASSAWYKEIQQHGPYASSSSHRQDIDWLKINREEDNPYVDAWWRWWPELAPTLNILRITGGEPLLHASTWKLLELLDSNPQPHLELNINSNLSVKPILVDRLVEKYNLLQSSNKIKWFELYTSLDTWGPRAAYIRNGIDLNLWERNFDTFLRGAWVPVSFMITYNALSVTTFKEFLVKILEWRARYNSKDSSKKQRIKIDTPYLKEPDIFNMLILPKNDFLPYMDECLSFMQSNCQDGNNRKFSTLEIDKFKRIVDYMRNTSMPANELITARRNFHNWIIEHDRRHGKNFRETFPEMNNFMDLCGEDSEW